MSATLFRPGSGVTLTVEVAWGADLSDSTGASWTWDDVTADVRHDPGISTSLGRADESSVSSPAELTLTLDNTSGGYSLGGRSSHYPYVRRGTPVRVTVNPGTGGTRTVFLGYAAGWAPGWDSQSGKVPVVTLTAAGTLRRLAQGASPVVSPYRRAMTAASTVVAYWPMEDGSESVYLECARGGTRMTYDEGAKLAAADEFLCSEPIVEMGKAAFDCYVTPYTGTGENQVRFLMAFPDNGLDDGDVLAHVWLSGSTLQRMDLTYEIISGNEALGLFFYSPDGALISSHFGGFSVDGSAVRISLELTQSGGNVNWSLGTTRPQDTTAGYITGTLTGRNAGIVQRVQLNPWGQADGASVGHLTVENDITSLWAEIGPLTAYRGDWPAAATASVSRFTRLCAENNLPLSYYSGASPGPLYYFERMGPQRRGPLLELLRDAETMLQGQIWDGRTTGIAVTLKHYRESPVVLLSVPATSVLEFAPTDDDQRTRNRVKVSQIDGTATTFEDTTGVLGTAAVGVYEDSADVSCLDPAQTYQHAAWRVSLGTVYGYRVPTVTIDLRQFPTLASAALDSVPGDKITITGISGVMRGFPPEDITLVIEGIAHEISQVAWTVTFQCSPWQTWGIGWAAADLPAGDPQPTVVLRGDSDGSTLASSAAQGATSLSVSTPTGPRWTTSASDYPFPLSVGGVRVVATACSGAGTTQTFTVSALPVARSSGARVELWNPPALGV